MSWLWGLPFIIGILTFLVARRLNAQTLFVSSRTARVALLVAGLLILSFAVWVYLTQPPHPR